MTVDRAIARCRALDRQAAEGWPLGYEFIAVRALAVEAVQVLDAAATTPERARELMQQLQGAAA